MEFPSKRLKISRIDSRYRSLQGEVSLEEQSNETKESLLLLQQAKAEEEDVAETADLPLLIRERKSRRIMGRGHRMFHHRQAEGAQHVHTGVLTVIVDVIATIDSNGNVVGRETLPPTTQDAISVAAAPTVPQVPPVPAYPSDLTVPAVPPAPTVVFPSVPAYPFPSGVPTQVSSSGYNTTSSISSTTLISSSNTSSTLSSTSTSSSSSSSSSSTSSSSSFTSSSSSSTLSSISSSTSQPLSTTAFVGGGGANSAAPPAATNTAASNNTGSGGGSALSTPKVVGSVIGSLAGAAILLIFLLLLIRWHKRKQRGALPLGNGTDTADTADNQPIATAGQQMSQSKRASFAPMFSRFSGMSRSTADTSTTGERSFQRISGRKLPSAFSEGMTSDQFAPREGTLSESSFYRDESGFYGGPGGPRPPPSPSSPSGTGTIGQKEKMMPSPARTPVIHHPEDAPPWGTSRNGGNTLSPPHSPNPDVPPRGTLGRSHPSHDGSRGSKFTEDV